MKKIEQSLEFPSTLKVMAGVKNKRYDVEKMCKVMLHYVLGYYNISFSVVYNEPVIRHFSTDDIKLEAILDHGKLPHTYVLYLATDSTTPLETILSHEMVHLDQYERGDLQLHKEDKLHFVWKGREYDPSMPYEDRPWEKEAFSHQYEIWKKAKKVYYG